MHNTLSGHNLIGELNRIRAALRAGVSPWEMLTPEERRALTPKLRTGEPVGPVLALEAALLEPSEASRLVALRNFIIMTGATYGTRVWREIESLEYVFGCGLIEVTVKSVELFTEALEAEGYAVNRWWDRLPGLSKHPNVTARQLTDSSRDPALHFANDDDSRPRRFWAHVDRRSTHFRGRIWSLNRFVRMIHAGLSHKNAMTPFEVYVSLLDRELTPVSLLAGPDQRYEVSVNLRFRPIVGTTHQ